MVYWWFACAEPEKAPEDTHARTAPVRSWAAAEGGGVGELAGPTEPGSRKPEAEDRSGSALRPVDHHVRDPERDGAADGAGLEPLSLKAPPFDPPPDTVHRREEVVSWQDLGDVNGDGVADLVWVENVGDTLPKELWMALGPALTPARWGTAPFDSSTIELGDVTGDGLDDAIIRTLDGWLCAPGTASGPSAIVWEFGADQPASWYSARFVGDVDDDGYEDLVTGPALWFGSPKGPVPGPVLSVAPPYSDDLTVYGAGDVDGDGFDDVLVSGSYEFFGDSGVLTLHRGSPTGPDPTAAPSWTWNGGVGAVRDVVQGDLDGDGDPELVVVEASSEAVTLTQRTVVLGDLDGPAPVVVAETGVSVEQYGYLPLLALASDEDADGWREIALALEDEIRYASVIGQDLVPSTDVWGPTSGAPFGRVRGVETGDVDGDGLLETVGLWIDIASSTSFIVVWSLGGAPVTTPPETGDTGADPVTTPPIETGDTGEAPAEPPEDPPAEEKGCGCGSGGARGVGAGLAPLLVLGAVRRRRLSGRSP